MKIVVAHNTITVDDYHPWRTAAAVMRHYLRPRSILAALPDRDREFVLLSNLFGMFKRIGCVSLEHGLNRYEGYAVVIFELRHDLLQRRESTSVTAGAPGLKEE